MTTRNDLERRIADLADDWDEQNRILHWVLRDLGGEPARLLGDSPFGAFASDTPSRASTSAKLGGGGIGV